MTSSFLAAAKQGRNGWKQYLAGIFLLILGPILALGILLTFLLLILSISNPYFRQLLKHQDKLNQFLGTRFYGFPFLVFILSGVFSVLFLLTLVFVLRKIHHRDFFTLFGSNEFTFHWQRVAQGFCIWLGLKTAILFGFYLINPSRYRFSFNASEWLFSFPFSLLLAGYLSLAFCLFFYGYLFQGMSCMIQKPVRLIIIYGLILGALLAVSSKDFIFWIWSICFQMFLLWIILKDKKLEVVIGLMMADFFFSYAILSSVSAKIQTPTILVRSADTLPSVTYLILLGIEAALFYYLSGAEKSRKLDV